MLGASSISQLDSAYSQNFKNAAKYIAEIENNLAVYRGYSVNKEQKIVRDVINSIMCNYYLDIEEIAIINNCNRQEVIRIIDFDLKSLKTLFLMDCLKLKSLN